MMMLVQYLLPIRISIVLMMIFTNKENCLTRKLDKDCTTITKFEFSLMHFTHCMISYMYDIQSSSLMMSIIKYHMAI